MNARAFMASAYGARMVGIVTVLAALALLEALIRANIVNPYVIPLPSQIAAAIPRVIVEEHVLQRFLQTTLEVAWASLLLVVVGINAGALLYRYRLLRLASESWIVA